MEPFNRFILKQINLTVLTDLSTLLVSGTSQEIFNGILVNNINKSPLNGPILTVLDFTGHFTETSHFTVLRVPTGNYNTIYSIKSVKTRRVY